MFNDLSTYFYDNVVAAYNDYIVHRDGTTSGRSKHLRKAIEVATVLFHFREHYAELFPITRKQVSKECADFRLIADVTNAAKHSKLDRPIPDGQPLIASANAIVEMTTLTTFEDELGEYAHQQTSVVVECVDGVTRNLDTGITVVFNFWAKRLSEQDVFFYPQQVPSPEHGSVFVKRQYAKPAAFELVTNLPWKQTLKLLRFDPAKGCAEPDDLSRYDKLELNTYKPRPTFLDVNFTLPDGRTGKL